MSRARPSLLYFFDKPRISIYLLLTGLVLAAWLYMLLMALYMSEHYGVQNMGPGMPLLDNIWRVLQPDAAEALRVLLFEHGQSSHVHSELMPAAVGYWSFRDLFLVFIMWQIMVVAMMLPTASPTILAFADISANEVSGAALRKRLAFFVLGYLNLWAAYSLIATLLLWLLRYASLLSPGFVSLSPYLSAAVLLLAGLYQLSPWKEACLAKCRNPLAFFMTSWRSGDRGALLMGSHHAIYCIGCCWALMLVMLVVGGMNILWAVILGGVMMLEKVVPKSRYLVMASGFLCFLAALLYGFQAFGLFQGV